MDRPFAFTPDSRTRREIQPGGEFPKEKQEAIESLEKLGVFKKVRDLELYHGRAGDGNGTWQVDPNFNNAGDTTKHNNINKIPALNTSSKGIADQFAEARAKVNNSKKEIYKITSKDPDAIIVDPTVISSLNEDDRDIFKKSIKELSIPPVGASPLPFEERHALDNLKPNDFKGSFHGLMMEKDVPDIIQIAKNRTNNPEEVPSQKTVLRTGSAINTKRILESGSLSQLCRAYLDGKNYIEWAENNTITKVPVNWEYMQSWFKEYNIVGYKTNVTSATLDFKKIDNYLLFDLDRIDRPSRVTTRAEKRQRGFGALSNISIEQEKTSKNSELIDELESNLFIKPHQIIELAKQTPGFQEIFDEDAGNSEGYTLGNHTETVLRVLDEKYADALPAKVLPIIRLALLTHDIGKSRARRDGKDQYSYNQKYASEFMHRNNIEKETSDLVLFLIGEGKTRIEKILIKPSKDKKTAQQNMDTLNHSCEKALKAYFKTDNISPELVGGLRAILGIIQTCDSGAYTSMAKTFDRKTGIAYRNKGSFDSSFDNKLNWKR